MAFSSPKNFRKFGRRSSSSLLNDTLSKNAEHFEPLLAFENNAPAEESHLDLGINSDDVPEPEPAPPSVVNRKLFWLKMGIVMLTLFVAESSRV